MVKVSIRRVRGLMLTKPKIQDGPGAVLPSGALSVECQNISFSYQLEQPILKNLSFHPRKKTQMMGVAIITFYRRCATSLVSSSLGQYTERGCAVSIAWSSSSDVTVAHPIFPTTIPPARPDNTAAS